MLLVPQLQIRANSIYSFVLNEDRDYSKRFLTDASGNSLQSMLYDNLRQHATYTGTLKQGAKKRLIKAIDFMVQVTEEKKIFNPVSRKMQPFRIGFVTLTVSSSKNMTGKEAHKKLLEPFLQWMRRTQNVRSYIWKAELQRRGQIHYHLTIDNFIHWRAIRNKWNELQKNAGLLEEYYKKHRHYDPNSIDVHSTKKIRNISGYLIKEIAKSFQNEKSIEGKVWDCSKNLKACKYFVVNESMDYAYVNFMVAEKEMRVIETDHCYIYEFINRPASTILSPGQLLEYNKLLHKVRTGEEETKEKIIKELPVFTMQPITVTQSNVKSLFSNGIDCVIDMDISPHLFSSS